MVHKTKYELVNEIVERTGFNPREVTIIVDSLIETIKEALNKGEQVDIDEFGTFLRHERKDRTVTLFKPNKSLREKLSE